MKRKILSFLIVLILLFSLCLHSFAHEKEEHNRIMKLILFGENVSESTLAEEPKTALSALEAACYLTLDQFNGKSKDNGIAELKVLKGKGVRGIPKDISEIDFNGNQKHRMFTHKGWEHIYKNDKANWSVRKRILVNTVNKVFDFGFSSHLPFVEPSNKCYSFAAFLGASVPWVGV